MQQSDTPWCPDCGTPLVQVDSRQGKEAWACPVAMRGKAQNKIGTPQAKHKDCWIYELKAYVEGH